MIPYGSLAQEWILTKIDFLCKLKEKIGDQKIDAILNINSLNYNLPIYEIEKSEGVKIV